MIGSERIQGISGFLRLSVVAASILSLCLCSNNRFSTAQEDETAGRGRTSCTLSLPWDDSLVRADVPVFGVADAPDFLRFRVEYGEGADPKEWHAISVSARPQPKDPWTAGQVKWNPDSGGKGNLAVWHTGVSSYNYPGRKENLNGVYTLRLVVETESTLPLWGARLSVPSWLRRTRERWCSDPPRPQTSATTRQGAVLSSERWMGKQ